MRHDMVVSRYEIPTVVQRIDGLSMGPRGLGCHRALLLGLDTYHRINLTTNQRRNKATTTQKTRKILNLYGITTLLRDRPDKREL